MSLSPVELRQLQAARISFAVVLIGIGSAAAHAADIAGKWESSDGPVTITQESDGRYSVAFANVEGTVVGSVVGSSEGDIFQGTWVRKHASERCPSERDGSPYWGGFRVTFYRPETFNGWWYPCTDELVDGMRVESWSGARAK